MDEKSCFIIMPYGERPSGGGETIDFDLVHEHILVPAIRSLEAHGLRITPVRCDKIAETGWIHGKMIRYIIEADVAVVDITTGNPNVFYELGVRHALCRKVTVLVRKRGTAVPFNIEGFKVIDYDFRIDLASAAIQEIATFIRNGLSTPGTDSLIYEVIGDLRVERGLAPAAPGTLPKTEQFSYRLRAATHKRIAIVTGDLRNVRGIDVWVNAENTNMQMARFYDRSMSGLVRYYGAKRNPAGSVVDDVIANELTQAMAGSFGVPPAHVIATTAGNLEGRGVKRVLHAAVVEGSLGEGYRPIPDVSRCVRNALEKIDQDLAGEKLQSVLFPIFGTGTAAGSVASITLELLREALAYLEAHRDSPIHTIAFLAQRRDQLDACQAFLARNPALEFVEATVAPLAGS